MVARDAIRAASAGAYPTRAATCVTAPGAYTEPAQSPIIEIRRKMQLRIVRRRYSGEKSARKASRARQPPVSVMRWRQRSGSLTLVRM